MVEWVFSGLRETTSADVFHHFYSTRNVTRKEGSVPGEFRLLGQPGRCSGSGNMQRIPWQYTKDDLTGTRITEELKCLIPTLHTLSHTAL